MVVGQPETNQEQVPAADVPPPGLNRMVTGNEMTPSYINYQRQADGEVSQSSSVVIPRPQSNSPFTGHHQNGLEVSPTGFNTSDRNLYLVAGESDLNDQRVVPGVESDVAHVLNPMQNLHIEDDDDFVNISVTTHERNVNVDGMETSEQEQSRSIDTQPREEAIDGANDNTDMPAIPATEHDHVEPETDLREEAIEGANDEKPKPDKKHKSEVTMSSEDSELRALSKQKPKSRRSKKYADDSNESENELSDSDKRDKYRRGPREKMSREDYERSRRKEKERRSGDRPRKNDDTDGSKYGDSRKRTDDDEDDYRKTRDKFKKSLRRNQEGDEVDDKERKKRSDKYRESGSRRSKLISAEM